MRVLYCLLGLLALLIGVLAQAPIPNRPDGFASPAGGAADAPVVLEAFVDLLCPASQAAWPTLASLIASYSGEGAFVVTNSNVSAAYNYFDFSFNIQSQFYNPATASLSTNQIISNLAAAVEKNGIMSATAFTNGINDSDLNMDARVAWKYACSRGISGTPSFLINGVTVNASPYWTVADWQAVINPLLAANARKGLGAYKVKECPSGTTFCQYNKTASECCTEGEYCIPNVGCRC